MTALRKSITRSEQKSKSIIVMMRASWPSWAISSSTTALTPAAPSLVRKEALVNHLLGLHILHHQFC